MIRTSVLVADYWSYDGDNDFEAIFSKLTKHPANSSWMKLELALWP